MNDDVQEPTLYPFRVFISYSHKDKPLAEKMVGLLQQLGLQPLWDQDIHPGKPFTDEIKDLIARSHFIIPLITKNSQERPWVHQETGYAQAINIPILPIVPEDQQLPDDMIAQLQAIVVKPELENLVEQLQQVDLERLVLPLPRKPRSVVAVADWPETRAELMLQHLHWLADLGVFRRVRHRASSTTFSIPDRSIHDPAWQARDGVFDGRSPRSDYFHHLQQAELRALKRHVQAAGCSLMMSRPQVIAEQRGPIAGRVRLESLSAFFALMADDQLQVLFLPQPERSNLVIVGDYFVAESVVSRPAGWLQTVFNSHPPTVLQRVRQFDQEFENLYAAHGRSRQAAMDEIKQVLDTLPPLPAHSDHAS